jgi:ferric-dicitrate binding protein FerR (iron transport regulator)
MDNQFEKYFEESGISGSIADERKKQYFRYKTLQGLFAFSDKAADREESALGYRRFLRRLRRRKICRIAGQSACAAAACALLALATYRLTILSVDKPSAGETVNTLYVPAGQRVKVTLQDGTAIWLNAKTTLFYPTVFGRKERRVKVEGEAFFEIADEEKRPFIVSVRDVDLSAPGTKFNVYNYLNEPSVRVSLISGKLNVCRLHGMDQAVVLNANEEVTVDSERMTKQMIAHPDYFLWKDGIYSFHNERLGDMLKKLERYYDVEIVAEDPSIAHRKYTGKFRQREGIDEIIRMIQKIHRFKVNKDEENNVFTLK